MRFVTRGPTPKSLDGPTSAGGKELAKARAFFNRTSTKKVEFAAYKADDVRAALDRDFRNKCAYCESNIGATQPMDVEHYRPKAEVVADGTSEPGYWWLAAEWTNLYPSCIDCNRERKQELVGGSGRTTAGKANQFPLAAGSARAVREGEQVKERPLLLDPCVDDPSLHLEFLGDGNVRPRLVGGADSPQGTATIEVVALRRKGLADRRAAVATQVAVAITSVEETIRDINHNKSLPLSPQLIEEEHQVLMERLRRRIDAMESHAKPEAIYSAIANEMIRGFKARMGL